MIPATTSITQIDNIDAEEIHFGIGDPRWVMRSMADLYSNRELACAREYSTNAHDANKERAIFEGEEVVPPIRVELPTMMSPYFKVRDFGFGMSREVLTEVYTQFGESTKRVSNDFNGMLGFGSKSAIAYTESFTVTSIHEGIKTVAVIFRKPDYAIVMKVVSQEKSDEPSGTEILVPVHNHDEFRQKAIDFYRFWPADSVLIDGELNTPSVGDEITPGLFHSKDSMSRVVMGNVAYRINNPRALFSNRKLKEINFVAYVENGDVEFTPSREDLKYTDQTIKCLHGIVDDFADKIMAEAQKEIDAATTHMEAFTAYGKWANILGGAALGYLEFNGDKFEDEFPLVSAKEYRIPDPNSYYNQRTNTYTVHRFEVSKVPSTMFVTEFSPELASSHKAKAKEYIAFKGWTGIKRIVFIPAADVSTKWVDKKHFVAWETIKTELPKKPRNPSSYSNNPNAGRVAGSWDYYTPTTTVSEKPLPDDVTDLYYISVQEDKRYMPRTILNNAGITDAAVIIVPANRLAKFLRENPTVKNFIPEMKKLVVSDGKTLLTPRAIELMGLSSDVKWWAKYLDLNEVIDPRWKTLGDTEDEQKRLVAKYEANIVLAQSLRMPYDCGRHDVPESDMGYFDLYPLVKQVHIGWHNKPSVTLRQDYTMYMNAAYAARKDEDD